MYKKSLITYILGFLSLIIFIITAYFSYKYGYDSGWEEGKEWTIQTILDYDPTPIICDEDCAVS